ncbi:F-box/FBD/LRR-repeat protein At1g13570-like isoform X1 [Triticum dicoccoides]|uniref:F-box/FBD/LRR-repeat protein At1g13570-like isoform X1 n=1 Tax=Triticum dicoccoides TaxID=85692 RepID=UPI0018904A7E|nr:F-box/FBD/LRR-repeat protein At1g13570-like isoform X1 [Triticum dicoccoides]XP_037488543.1 F-box/FBD/LRR-repeat protein At1g13570-like isoform X1 [Triticum dicoccoides]
MAEQLQPPFDPATAADPHGRERCAELMLAYIYHNLPSYPLYDGARFTALAASRGGADRLSRLPRDLLRNVLARLPVKDAARTAALSSRWRALWRSTPLVLADIHLLPKARALRPTPADSPAVTAAVSRVLEAHPGPFGCVHLVCSQMDGYRAQLARWVQLLAAKGVQELVLVNRPWPLDVPLPASLFTITTLTRLYLGVWKLPGTAALRGASFPRLRELGLYFVEMEHGVVDSLVARSPVLEVLNIVGCINGGLRLRLVSQSLRCVQICGSVLEDIAVVKAPRLERLILIQSCKTARDLCTRLRIVDAPKLHTFGYLEPGQVLEVGETVIMPGINARSASAMLSSVKILTLNVRFGVRNDVKMVSTFLKCFPNAERLHIVSDKCDKPTGDHLTVKFWEESGPIENVLGGVWSH